MDTSCCARAMTDRAIDVYSGDFTTISAYFKRYKVTRRVLRRVEVICRGEARYGGMFPTGKGLPAGQYLLAGTYRLSVGD